MKTRKKRAARFHSQSEAPQASGNQEEAQEEISSLQCASDPGRAVLHMASLPGVQLASPSVDLHSVTDRPTGDLTIVCTDALSNVDAVCLTTANNVIASDYTVSTVSSDMGRALSAFCVVQPSVGLDEVVTARAQDRDSVFDSQSAAADREVELISGSVHNLTSVGGLTVTDRSSPPLLTPRPISYWSSRAPSRQSVHSRHSVSSRVQNPMFDFMNNLVKFDGWGY